MVVVKVKLLVAGIRFHLGVSLKFELVKRSRAIN
jgi:hypothetical protein